MLIRSCLLLAGLLLWSVAARAEWATLVFEPAKGTVLHAENAGAPRYPASLTKIMTAYLVIEAIEKGQLRLADKLTVSKAAASQPAVRLGLRSGKTITVKEALEAMVLKSANDAAVVLAEAVAGDERAFARRMTAKARALGMRWTKFVNASGLPARSQVTTVYDMALLAAALLRDYPDSFPLFSQTSFVYRKRRYGTINGWLTSYNGADGIKTGFTCAAGYNLVASATQDGHRLIAVAMGGESSQARIRVVRTLMNTAFDKIALPDGTLPQIGDIMKRRKAQGRWVPPHVLPGDRCAQSKEPAKLVLEDGPFPGWGIIFGSYAERSEALSKIEKNRAELGELVAKPRPAVVVKTRAGVERYSALLVALDERQSLNACRHLREAGDYCLRLRPEVLNNTEAKWR